MQALAPQGETINHQVSHSMRSCQVSRFSPEYSLWQPDSRFAPYDDPRNLPYSPEVPLSGNAMFRTKARSHGATLILDPCFLQPDVESLLKTYETEDFCGAAARPLDSGRLPGVKCRGAEASAKLSGETNGTYRGSRRNSCATRAYSGEPGIR
jgi:hypothetical protein